MDKRTTPATARTARSSIGTATCRRSTRSWWRNTPSRQRVAAWLGPCSHRDELWDRCYQELMANVHARLAQEITRLGGHYAHVHDESIETRHDDAAGETWLHGFSEMLNASAGLKHAE